MTKSLANKLHLNERLYTICMAEDTPIRSILDEFNTIIMDLENIDIKIEDEDKVVLLIVSLPYTYKHFKEIILYSNNDTLSFKDINSNLLLKFDLEIHYEDKAEDLSVKDRTKKGGAPITRYQYINKGIRIADA